MEEVFDWNAFWQYAYGEELDVEAIIKMLPSTYIQCGKTNYGSDLLSTVCSAFKIDEYAIQAAELLFTMGYVYCFGCPSYYDRIICYRRWKLFRYLMDRSGAYRDPARLSGLIGLLDNREMDPFLDRGTCCDTTQISENNYQRFITFRAAREKARIASIALIGAGKWRKRVDVFRVISRVVWSERCDESWLTN